MEESTIVYVIRTVEYNIRSSLQYNNLIEKGSIVKMTPLLIWVVSETSRLLCALTGNDSWFGAITFFYPACLKQR